MCQEVGWRRGGGGQGNGRTSFAVDSKDPWRTFTSEGLVQSSKASTPILASVGDARIATQTRKISDCSPCGVVCHGTKVVSSEGKVRIVFSPAVKNLGNRASQVVVFQFPMYKYRYIYCERFEVWHKKQGTRNGGLLQEVQEKDIGQLRRNTAGKVIVSKDAREVRTMKMAPASNITKRMHTWSVTRGNSQFLLELILTAGCNSDRYYYYYYYYYYYLFCFPGGKGCYIVLK